MSKKDQPLFRVNFKHDKLGVVQFFAWKVDFYALPLIHATEICENINVISRYVEREREQSFHNFSSTHKITFPYYQLVLAEELHPIPNNNLKPIQTPPPTDLPGTGDPSPEKIW